MQQLTYLGPNELAWRDAPEPDLGSNQSALVRPVAVATCDLDALIISGTSPFDPPFAVGHECVAEVVEIGDEITSVRPGQLVSVPFQVSCGDCAACKRGRTGNCGSVEFMSTYGFGPTVERWGGFLSDLVRVPYADHMLVPVPEGLEPAQVASASDNISDAWRAVAPPLDADPGAPVLVVGGASSGSIGLYAAGIAVALGAESVLYVDADPDRRAIAQSTRRRHARPNPEAARPLPDHRRRERRPRRPSARAALDRSRRDLHEHRDLLRRPADAAAARDVHQMHHLQNRPRTRPRSHPARTSTGRQGALHPELVTTNTVAWADAADALLQPGWTKLIIER